MPFHDLPPTGLLTYSLISLSACLTAHVATRLFRRLAWRFDLLDRPDQCVKNHREPIAYLGGLGILAGIWAGLLVGVSITSWHMKTEFVAILVAATLACGIGVLDDIWVLRARYKIGGQVLGAIILLIGGLGVTGVATELNILLAVVIVLGTTNSLNLLDGLDGLCAGVTAIITGGFLCCGVWQDPIFTLVCLALLGSLGGFLPLNRQPARIFMGDAGSLLLGLLCGALFLKCLCHAPQKGIGAFIILGLPFTDTLVAVLRRYRNHRPLFAPDRGHIYDQMRDRGLSVKRTVRRCYLVAGAYALIGVSLSRLPVSWALTGGCLTVLLTTLWIRQTGFIKKQAPPPKTSSPQGKVTRQRDHITI